MFNNAPPLTKKFLQVLAWPTYLVMLIMAWVLYKERVIFSDAIFYFFNIVKDEAFNIEHNRWPTVFTQCLPVWGAKLGLDLESLMRLYSANFILYFALLFGLTLWAFRQVELAFSILLFNVLMVADTFYWIQSEFPSGIVFGLMLMAFLSYRRHNARIWHWLLLVPMAATLTFFHPLIVIVGVFLVVFLAIEYREDKKFWREMGFVLLISLLAYGIKGFFIESTYDSQAMGALGNFVKLFPDYWNLPSNRQFLSYLVEDFYFLPVFLLAATWVYVRAKKWLFLTLLWSFFLGYLLLVNVSYYQTPYQFHLENQYLPLSLFVILPFVYHVLPRLGGLVKVPLLGVILLTCLFRIEGSAGTFRDRLDWERRLIQATQDWTARKVVIPEAQVPMDTLLMTWGTSFEVWALSTLEQGETRSILIEEDVNRMAWAYPQRQSFITKWEVFPYDALPPRYFVFKDSMNPYRISELPW